VFHINGYLTKGTRSLYFYHLLVVLIGKLQQVYNTMNMILKYYITVSQKSCISQKLDITQHTVLVCKEELLSKYFPIFLYTALYVSIYNMIPLLSLFCRFICYLRVLENRYEEEQNVIAMTCMLEPGTWCPLFSVYCYSIMFITSLYMQFFFNNFTSY
jgi:hypothetical protein